MSRSHKAAYCTDNTHSHESKKRAARVHRHAENASIAKAPEMYVAQPSEAYTSPYDICDYRFPAGDDGWRVKGREAIRK